MLNDVKICVNSGLSQFIIYVYIFRRISTGKYSTLKRHEKFQRKYPQFYVITPEFMQATKFNFKKYLPKYKACNAQASLLSATVPARS